MACRPAARRRLTVAAGVSKPSTSYVGTAPLVSSVPESWICQGAPSAGAHRAATVALLDVAGLAVAGAGLALLTWPAVWRGSRSQAAAPVAVATSTAPARRRLPED